MNEAQHHTALLEHMDWVRDLARALLQSDKASIDDAVQETWLAASENPPPDSRALKPWLATILRRTIWRQRRSDNRRLERERRAARPEAIEPAADAVARATAQRDVVDAVLELDEPYRSTLITRYFDGLGPSAIATRDGVPLETVRSRLRRGLEKLRESLDQQRGGSSRTRALLLLVVHPRATAVAVHASAWRNATRIAAGLLVCAGVSVAVWSTFLDPLPHQEDQISLPELETSTADSNSDRTLAATTSADRRAAPRTSVTEPGIGQVLDTRGRPVANLTLLREGPHAVRWLSGEVGWIGNDLLTRRLDDRTIEKLQGNKVFANEFFAEFEHPAEWRATILHEPIPGRVVVTDANGTFPLTASRHDGLGIRCLRHGMTMIARGVTESGVRTWIASRSTDVQGHVRSDAGTPLPGCSVRWRYDEFDPHDLRRNAAAISGRRLDRVNDAAISPEVRSDERGFYRLHDVPVDIRVSIDARGNSIEFGSRRLHARLASKFDLVLRSARPTIVTLAGLVRRDDGSPASGASMAIGDRVVQADALGKFRIDDVPVGEDTTLSGWITGQGGVHIVGLARSLKAGSLSASSLVVSLQQRVHRLSGVVVDAHGLPQGGARIALDNPTHPGASLDTLEALVGGRSSVIETGADGKFDMTGLFDRSYRLRVWDESGRACLVSASIPPHERFVTLKCDRQSTRSFRIVSPKGNPIEGARATLVFRTAFDQSGRNVNVEHVKLRNTTADGIVVVDRCPERLGRLIIVDTEGQRSEFPLAGTRRGQSIELVHNGASHVQVLPPYDVDYDTAEFRSSSDETVPFGLLANNAIRRVTAAPRNENAGDVWLQIPNDAMTIVLLRQRTIVSRFTIHRRDTIVRGRSQ